MTHTNLRRYDEKGRRLSIFAQQSGNELRVYVQTCSSKDQFRKSYARGLSQFYFKHGEQKFKENFPNEHPRFYTILVEENKPKITFLNWCKTNFRKVKETILDNQKIIQRNGKFFLRTESF